jgi:hypothetical protein
MHTMRKMDYEPEASTLQPNICSNFQGKPQDVVQWQGAPSSYTITQVDSNHVFPFTPYTTNAQGLEQVSFPTPSTITIKPGLNTQSPNNVYSFNVSCCTSDNATHTVTVT